jgi:hypothetical protein
MDRATAVPGFVAVALALVGLGRRHGKERGFCAPPCLRLGLILAFDVSFGFNGVIYRAPTTSYRSGRCIPARMD